MRDAVEELKPVLEPIGARHAPEIFLGALNLMVGATISAEVRAGRLTPREARAILDCVEVFLVLPPRWYLWTKG